MPLSASAVKPRRFLYIKEVGWGDVNRYLQVSPGDKGVKLFIVIQNVYNLELRSIEAKLSIKPPFTDENGKTNTELFSYSPPLQPGQENTVKFTLNIDEGAATAYYSLDLTLTFDYQVKVEDAKGVHYYWSRESEKQVIRVPVLGKSRFKAQLKPKTVYSGEKNNIVFELKNLGDSAIYDLELRFSSANFISSNVVTGSSIVERSEVKPDGYIQVPISLFIDKGLDGKVGQLQVEVKFKDPYGFERTENMDLGYYIVERERKEPEVIIGKAYLEPEAAKPGETVSLEVELRNTGAGEARNIYLSVKMDEPLSIYGVNMVYIDKIKPYKSEKAVFHVSVDGSAQPGFYSGEIKVSYENADGDIYTSSLGFGLKVESIIETKLIDVTISNGVISPGETVKVEANVLVIGTSSANFVELRAGKGGALEGDFYLYIGRVDVDDPFPVEITLKLRGDLKPGDYSVPIKLTFYDDFFQKQEAYQYLTIKVSEKKEEFTKPMQKPQPGILNQIVYVLKKILGLEP